MEITIKPKNSFFNIIRELWLFRELLYYFTWRDIKVKYKETTLGIAWVVLQPLVMAALFIMIFSKGLRIYDNELPYPIFVLSGLVLWNFVSGALTHAAHSMELNAKIIKKTYFPRMIVPLSAILVAIFDLFFGLILLLAACLWFNVPIHLGKAFAVISVSFFLLMLASSGFACLFSILNAIFKDFRYIIPFVVQVLFFTTPVFYDLSILGEGWWSELYEWNPFSSGIQLFRSIFDSTTILWLSILKPFLTSFLIFMTGMIVFNKLEPKLADLI